MGEGGTGDKAHWYFAYGSNMQTATLQGRRRIQPLQARVGLLRGFNLCFDIPIGSGRRGVANLIEDPAASLWGVLYLLTVDQHDRLDRTEGVPSGIYRRRQVEVVVAQETVVAETLISDRRSAGRLPSHRYHRIILEGAKEHGLPAAWVTRLQAWELAWDEREGAINPPGVKPA